MIGSGIKKFAKAHDMKCAKGIAFGYLNGFYISLTDGAGTKTMQVCLASGERASERNAACFAALDELMSQLDPKRYRLMPSAAYIITDSHMIVTFADNPGTLKRVKRFIVEVFPQIAALGFEGGDACYHCGRPLNDYRAFVLKEGLLMPVYGDCAADMMREDIAASGDKKPGSAFMGALGAFLGAIAGAIPWALLFLVGYVTSLAGLLIGFLADLGYRKFGGRNSKARLAVVLVMVLIGVMAGTVGGYALSFTQQYNELGDDKNGFTYSGFMTYCAEYFILYDQETAISREYDRLIADYDGDIGDIITLEEFTKEYYDPDIDDIRAELLGEMYRNLALGALFGILGSIGIFIKVHGETKRSKLIKLPRL